MPPCLFSDSGAKLGHGSPSQWRVVLLSGFSRAEGSSMPILITAGGFVVAAGTDEDFSEVLLAISRGVSLSAVRAAAHAAYDAHAQVCKVAGLL